MPLHTIRHKAFIGLSPLFHLPSRVRSVMENSAISGTLVEGKMTFLGYNDGDDDKDGLG